ncbi:hypothetical protein RO3G_12953 [Rhizopus delemar RA 99-880]|uniref:Uncharacterized protein n=1 Tax=Rhizopus delemar (strain RA 99-880 / ATCC MYA-4621 / FGSC 9543 / NRRL 43880) TaxID=246409 RepID=I1CIG2_RHIO9|nr:hypothetical protein RO3G_12953 [Rhizopus delemar RA 99-880]|eukprot:EIE88242.1 hypothetical protein RO3G_12953 [Rhizopus delemar RA 99-880]
MPPGSTKPDNNNDNNMQNLNNILTQDEIEYLLSHFETHRKSLRCPNCEKKGIFRRNGSNKSEPPQPIFRCNGCSSSFRAKTMLNIVNSIQLTPANAQTSMNPEFSGSFQGATSSQARVPIGQIHSRLRKLDINNSRIIDIHYPDRNIVALLIHNDYEDELRQQLQRFKVTIKEDFNPCDPQVLRDPKYADRTPAEREDLAFMHHCNRIERALQYIRTPVKFSVARYFYLKGWISKQLLQETLPTRTINRQQDIDIFFSDDDHMSTFKETKDMNQATAPMDDTTSI